MSVSKYMYNQICLGKIQGWKPVESYSTQWWSVFYHNFIFPYSDRKYWEKCHSVLKFYFHIFHKHLLVASVRESKTARLIYTPAQWGCVCVCLWLESLYACIQSVLPGGFPNRKDIFRTVNMNSVVSGTTEITPQYINVKIDSIKGRKFFFSVINNSPVKTSLAHLSWLSFSYILNIVYLPARQYFISLKFCWITIIAHPMGTH